MQTTQQNTQTVKLLPLALFVACAILTGCEPELPSIIWEGQYIKFGTTSDTLPCGDALNKLDLAVGQLQQKLNQKLPNDTKITYYWLPDGGDLFPCSSGAAGCCDETVIFAKNPFMVHELVHAIMHPYGLGHPFFVEGIAVAYQQNWHFNKYVGQNISIDHIKKFLIPGQKHLSMDYWLAGYFTNFLINKFGIEKYKQLYKMTSNNSDYWKLNGMFIYVFGVSLHKILAEIEDLSLGQSSCFYPHPTCSGLTLPLFDKIVLNANCNEGDFIKTTLDLNLIWSLTDIYSEKETDKNYYKSSLLLEIVDPKPFYLIATPSFKSSVFIRIIPCFEIYDELCHEPNFDFFTSHTEKNTFMLQPALNLIAGFYMIEVLLQADLNNQNQTIELEMIDAPALPWK